MYLLLRPVLLLPVFIFVAHGLSAQVTVTGTVFDSAKRNYVKDVRVESTGGNYTMTDSMGRYSIPVKDKDSLTFIYQNKPTQKFVVAAITDIRQFDIQLHVRVRDGIKTLQEVVIYANSHRQDSMENREVYADYFGYRKPTIRTSISPGGAVGADVNEIINMFRFKRNKRLKAFQARLEQQEQDQYVRFRFNKKFVGRITQLKGAELDSFMIRYEPTYEFASTADEVTFNRYILNSSYTFRIELLQRPAAILPEQTKK